MPSHSASAILFRNGTAAASAAHSLLSGQLLETWPVHDAQTLATALTAADEARAQGRFVVFALDYEVGAVLEAAVPQPEKHAAPIGYVWIFDGAQWLTSAEADAWLLSRDAVTEIGRAHV